MCGIAGVLWKRDARPFDDASVHRHFNAAIRHRGPDADGVFFGDGFTTVHRRLSIIDIAHGQQPMTLQDGDLGVCYNGEIYNYQDIRDDLQREGWRFDTNCDTEVLLKLFAAHGPAGFDKLEGMFSAFIWDRRNPATPQYYLVRDPLGVKPLYLYEDDDCFLFCSEITPIITFGGLDLSPDPQGLASYLTFRYPQAPYTAYARIQRIEAGTYLKVTGAPGALSVMRHRYWDVPSVDAPLSISMADAAAELRRLLRGSVARQQMAETPVGVLLSGGLDSSVIAALCADVGAHLKSFNIGFPTLNEFEFSDDVAHKHDLPHYKIETTPEDMAENFGTVVRAMDDLIADPACFPLYLLCSFVREHVTVLLSGEGSDEMLGGYPQYTRTINDGPAPSGDQFERFLGYSWYFNKNAPPVTQTFSPSRLRMFRKYFTGAPLLEGMLAYDQKTWLPENLMMKADKILMAHSLEGRFPFLAKDVLSFVAQLPRELKLGCANGKTVLREAFAPELPESVLTRPKMGFSVPVSDLVSVMHDPFYDALNGAAQGPFAGVLDFNAIRRDADDHYAGRAADPLRMWTLLVMTQWMTQAH